MQREQISVTTRQKTRKYIHIHFIEYQCKLKIKGSMHFFVPPKISHENSNIYNLSVCPDFNENSLFVMIVMHAQVVSYFVCHGACYSGRRLLPTDNRELLELLGWAL